MCTPKTYILASLNCLTSSAALKNRWRFVCTGHTHTGAILERLGDGKGFSVINMYEQGERDPPFPMGCITTVPPSDF